MSQIRERFVRYGVSEVKGGWLGAAQKPVAAPGPLRQRLPALARGEGVLESEFERYQAVNGPFPVRARTGLDPRDRRNCLIHAARQAGRR